MIEIITLVLQIVVFLITKLGKKPARTAQKVVDLQSAKINRLRKKVAIAEMKAAKAEARRDRTIESFQAGGVDW